MRHGKKVNHLGRKSQHRVLMLRNMASSLIMHKRIKTTVAKAKALRRFVEPLITRAKVNSTHNRRMCFRNLQQKEAVTELFTDVASRVGDRPGGYTRIVRIGNRYGDNAEMCIIELVDYNEVYTTERKASGGKKKTRRRRRGGGSKEATSAAAAAAPALAEATETVEETVTDNAEQAEQVVEQNVTGTVEQAEETVSDQEDQLEATVTDTVEEVKEEVQQTPEAESDDARDAEPSTDSEEEQ